MSLRSRFFDKVSEKYLAEGRALVAKQFHFLLPLDLPMHEIMNLVSAAEKDLEEKSR